MNKKGSQFGPFFWRLLSVFIILVVVVLFLPWALTQHQWFDWHFGDETGHIGDTIGGTVGPFVAIIASVLTFFAFWVQYQANQQQRRDLQIERFESRLFSMLEAHRSHLAEIRVENPYTYRHNGKRIAGVEVYHGRQAIRKMFQELRAIFKELENINNYALEGNPREGKVSLKLVFETAYLLFYLGINDDTKKLGITLWKKDTNPLFSKAFDAISQKQADQRQRIYEFPAYSPNRNEAGTDLEVISSDGESFVEPEYLIGRGNHQWLSHYHRQLYFMVKGIDEFGKDLLSYEDKKNYVLLIRAQLSTDEQLLLYYNALSAFGKRWWASNLLKEYNLVKNLPMHLADFYKSPNEEFGESANDGQSLFDWIDLEKDIQPDEPTSS